MPTDSRDIAGLLLKHGYSGTKKIGEGSFGVAVLVEDSEGNKNVAKLVDVSRASARETQEARKEARLLAQVKHPYIVRYRENFAELGWLCIVMDFCDGGDLGGQIDAAKRKMTRIDEQLVLKWFTQAMLALKYLHGKHILHRDLKPANIFLSKKGDLRLGDFGISKVMSCTAAFAKTFVGTPYYLSPEVITEKPYSWPSDIWSMGCILYQMGALQVPFDAQNITGLTAKVCKGPIPSMPNCYSEFVRDLQLAMMKRSASERPSANTVIGKPQIQEVVRAMLSAAQDGKNSEKPKAKHEVIDQFARFDLNGDGVVDRAELARVLKHLDAKVWTDENVSQIMFVADTNKDGRIQFEEFIEWVFGAGGNGANGVAKKVQQQVDMTNMALDHQDLEDFLEQLLVWRQYVDMGCLRISPPELSAKNCEALSWISIEAKPWLQNAPKDKAFDALRQIRAILQTVEQLVSESSRQHVSRIGSLASRAAVRGLVIERADGRRSGVFPGNAPLRDAHLQQYGNTRWDSLQKGERIIEVKGSAVGRGGKSRTPSPGPGGKSVESDKEDSIAATVVLCTNLGRELEYGTKLAGCQGEAFSFKAPEGTEIEEITFDGNTCTGVKTAPILVTWPREQVEKVREALNLALQAFWPLLLSAAAKMGPKFGSYALLEGRRFGLKDLKLPESEGSGARQVAGEVQPPSHWDLGVMGGLDTSGQPKTTAVQVELGTPELAMLQQLLSSTFVAERQAAEAAAQGMVHPIGLKLIRGVRLQNWPAWSGYKRRQQAIKEDLKSLEWDERASAIEADPVTASQLESLGIALDRDANCRWLFHGITSQAAARVSDPDFDIGMAGAEDGVLYGRGAYLAEYCSHVDRSVPEDDQGLRCLLVCRTMLGNLLRDDAVLPDKVHLIDLCTGGEYHGLLGDRSERCPGSLRDFVVYDKDQVYPEFLLWYRRAY